MQTRIYAGFGATWKTADVDIDWTDITDRALLGGGTKTKRGRDRVVDEFETGSQTIVLRNDDRAFDSEHAAGPYFGMLLPGVPIRVTLQPDGEAEMPIARGYAPDWVQESDDTNVWATCKVDGLGVFDKLSRATQQGSSVYDLEVLADGPLAYWKLDDQSEGLMLDSSGYGRDGIFDNAERSQDPLLADGGQSVFFDHVGDNRGRYYGQVVASFPCTIEAWVKTPRDLAAEKFIMIATDGYGQGFSWGIRSSALSPNGEQVISRTTRRERGTTRIDDDAVHHLVVSMATATSWDLYVDGVLESDTVLIAGSGTDVPSGSTWTIGNTVNMSGGDFGFDGFIDNVAVYPSALSAGRVAAHYEAGVAPWTGDRTDQRLERIFDGVGLPADRYDLEQGNTMLGTATIDDEALDVAMATEQAEDGRLFETADGVVRFLNRYWAVTAPEATNVQLSFSDDPVKVAAGTHLPYTSPARTNGDSLLINSATGNRVGGPTIPHRDQVSIDQFGEASRQFSNLLLSSDAEVRSLLEYKVASRSIPQLCIPWLRVKMGKLTPAQQAAVLALEIGYRIEVERTPQGVGAASVIEFFIEGVEFELGAGDDVTAVFYVSPTPDDDDGFWIWGTSEWDVSTRWAW